MGTLVFVPWTVLANGCRVGEFELKPLLIDPAAAVGDDRDWLNATPEFARVLRAYRTPPDIPLRTATLVRFADRDFGADLVEPDIDRLFTLGEAIAFTALTQRRFFSYGDYLNRDSLLLIAQRFVPQQGGVSIQNRRRDGRVQTFIPEEYWTVRQEGHIERLTAFKLDAALASAVLARMDTTEEFDRAVRSFNEANTDRSTISEAQELVSTVSAFQQFFGIRNGSARDTTQAFVTAMTPFPPIGTPTPQKPRVLERVRRGRQLREIWMDDLGALRGNVGHGHAAAAYPSAWSAKEHLLLAAHIFPLLVKSSIATAGGPAQSVQERDEFAAFDALLAAENPLGAEVEEHRVVTSYHWNSVRNAVLDEARRARVIATFSA